MIITHAAQPFCHLVVLAYPAPEGFDHAVVDAHREFVESHHQSVLFRDLHAVDFDPVLGTTERPTELDWLPAPDVAVELEHVRTSDIIVFVYPIWFGLPLAMLNGYVGRVLGAGYSFRDLREARRHPLVQGKPLLPFSTSSRAGALAQGNLRGLSDARPWPEPGRASPDRLGRS